MKYVDSTKKLQRLYTQLLKSELDIEALEKIRLPRISFPYYKALNKFESDWETGSITYTIELSSFLEDFLRFIKVVPIVKTNTGFESIDYLEDYDLYINLTQTSSEDTDLKNYTLTVTLTPESESNQQIYSKIVVLITNEFDFSEMKDNIL